MRGRGWLLAGVCGVLTLSAQRITYEGPRPGEELGRLKGKALTAPHGILVVLDDAQAQLSPRFRAVLQREPFGELDLPLRVIPPSASGLASDLRKTLGWPEGPRWAFLDQGFRVLVSGDGQTSEEDLAQSLATLNLVSSRRALEAFIRQHPERLDAQGALLSGLYAQALRRMAPFLKPLPEGTKDSLFYLLGRVVTLPQTRELLKPLSESEDAHIWGDAARRLAALLGLPEGAPLDLERLVPPQGAEHSPLMRTTARRGLPVLESMVVRHPRHEPTWRAYMGLLRCAGQGSPRTLLGRLEALPDQPPPTAHRSPARHSGGPPEGRGLGGAAGPAPAPHPEGAGWEWFCSLRRGLGQARRLLPEHLAPHPRPPRGGPPAAPGPGHRRRHRPQGRGTTRNNPIPHLGQQRDLALKWAALRLNSAARN